MMELLQPTMNVSLQDWMNQNLPVDDTTGRAAASRQTMFVRDRLQPMVGANMPRNERYEVARVISTHRSKSITLPVYRIDNQGKGLSLILRCNFYDWKLSVISDVPLLRDFGLFHDEPPLDPSYTGNELDPVYFEGFHRDLIFGYQKTTDGRSWSAAIPGDHALWTTLFLICQDLGIVERPRWRTREGDRAE